MKKSLHHRRADRLGLVGRVRELYTGECLGRGTCTLHGNHGVLAYRALYDQQLPWWWWRLARRFVAALALHLWHGCPKTTDHEHAGRLAICFLCPHYKDKACKLCGCDLDAKARWREQQCPIGKWPQLPPLLPPTRRVVTWLRSLLAGRTAR